VSILSSTFSEFPHLIRNRGFVRIWLSQVFGQTATNLLHFALVLRTFELTGSSFFVGVLVAVVSLPPILFGALGGVMADRYDRRTILSVINGSRVAVSLALLPFLDLSGVILVAVFLLTMLSEFFTPTEGASIPALVPPDHLTGANALFAFTLYGSFLVGYTAAGPLLHFGGPLITLVAVACLYAAAAVSTIGLPHLRDHLMAPDGVLKRSVHSIRVQLMEGLQFIRAHHLLPTLILEVSLLFGIERGVIALIPAVALGYLGFTTFTVSLYFILPLALGTVMGALITNRLKRTARPLTLVHAGMWLEACALLLVVPASMWLTRLVPAAPAMAVRVACTIAAALCAGLGNVMVVVSTQTLIQRETDDEKRGRVFGGLLTMMNLVGLPFILLLSHLGGSVPLTTLFTVLGLFLAAVAAVSATTVTVHWKRHPHPPDARL